jgi:hypothetical protein
MKKKENTAACDSKKQKDTIVVEKKSGDYCIINGNKIEGNACSTILNNE